MNNWKKLAKKLSLDYNQVKKALRLSERQQTAPNLGLQPSKKSAAIEWASTNCT